MKIIFKRLLGALGFYIAKKSTFHQARIDAIGSLRNYLTVNQLTAKEKSILSAACALLIENNGEIPSQLGQDLFALAANSKSRHGFYVEIGGGDPIRSSNTYLLQSKYEWDGILVEPNPDFVSSIVNLRSESNAPILVQKALAENTGKEYLLRAGLLSTLDQFIEGDAHSRQRKALLKKHGLIEVNTISPKEFVKEYVADRMVNFLSVDTEGAEMEIMSNWPFDLCKPIVICVEHNDRKWKSELDELITSHGYSKVLVNISKFDSWFTLNQ